MTYSITNVRRDNDKIFASVNGCVYVIRKSGADKYGSISLSVSDGSVIAWQIRCHRHGAMVRKNRQGWTVAQVVEIA